VLSLVAFLIGTAVCVLVEWRGVWATWRNDRRSFYVRHPEPPPWYPLGRTWYLASGRGIIFGGLLVAVIWGLYAMTLLTGGTPSSTARTTVLTLVVLTLVGYVLVGLFARPKRLVPPALRHEPAPFTLLLGRISARRRQS
jgi:hypothetical protein